MNNVFVHFPEVWFVGQIHSTEPRLPQKLMLLYELNHKVSESEDSYLRNTNPSINVA
jgi:hypothetical protein